MACTTNDFVNNAWATVFPIFRQVYPPQIQQQYTLATGLFPPNGTVFLLTMWNKYQQRGCDWWTDRIAHWTPQLMQMTPASAAGPQGVYHHQLKQAKLGFANAMLMSCDCFNAASPLPQQKQAVIDNFSINAKDISGGGEERRFTIRGTKGAQFSLEITNETPEYYNFKTNTFQTSPAGLYSQTLTNSSFTGKVIFPSVSDDDHYDINLTAGKNTVHSKQVVKRFADNSVDQNTSQGSSSFLLSKKLYQYTSDVTLTVSAISKNGLTGFGDLAVTTKTASASKQKSLSTQPLEVVVTAASTRKITINRQPTTGDVFKDISRTVGAAPVFIEGEDTSSGHYGWPINNVLGLEAGVGLFPTSPVAVGTIIQDYVAEDAIFEDHDFEFKKITKYIPAVERTGEATVVNGKVTVQPGNIMLNKQVANSFKDDTVKFYPYGRKNIELATGWNVEFKNLKVELTDVTTTTTGVVSNSTSIPVAERNGILDDVSTISGIGIDDTSAVPKVDSGAGTVSGAGTIVATAAQTLESGITLTFKGASRIATITGDIIVHKAGDADQTVYFDIERFLTAY